MTAPLSASTFRLAMAQMLVEGGQREANVARAEARIAEAARQNADVIVLPEALTLGWTHPSADSLAEPIPDGPSCNRLRAAAAKHHIYTSAGLVERSGDQIFNSAVLIDGEGKILLHHRKINELEIGHQYYALGDRLQVASTPWGRVGVMICADGFAPGQVIARTLGLMGASIILSPCAWAVPADHDNSRQPYGQLWRNNYGPVARDYRLWICGTSNVGPITAGPWTGRQCIGCSLLVGPHGRQVLMGPYGPQADTILYADVQTTPRPTQGDGWSSLLAQNK